MANSLYFQHATHFKELFLNNTKDENKVKTFLTFVLLATIFEIFMYEALILSGVKMIKWSRVNKFEG